MGQPFVFGQPPPSLLHFPQKHYAQCPQFFFRAAPPPPPPQPLSMQMPALQFLPQNSWYMQYNTNVQMQPVASSSMMRPAQAVSPATSDVSSAASSTSGSSPRPVHVVCTAPLVAPVPLPYHSPTFLQFDLPDDDEDLSHPPYVSRPHKRKRAASDDDDDDEDGEEMRREVLPDPRAAKRRAIMSERHGRWNTAANVHAVVPQPPLQQFEAYPGHAIYR